MKPANLLQDADADANSELFPRSSRPLGRGLCLDIAKRIGGFVGYGAAKAIFRIFWQKRLVHPAGRPKT